MLIERNKWMWKLSCLPLRPEINDIFIYERHSWWRWTTHIEETNDTLGKVRDFLRKDERGAAANMIGRDAIRVHSGVMGRPKLYKTRRSTTGREMPEISEPGLKSTTGGLKGLDVCGENSAPVFGVLEPLPARHMSLTRGAAGETTQREIWADAGGGGARALTRADGARRGEGGRACGGGGRRERRLSTGPGREDEGEEYLHVCCLTCPFEGDGGAKLESCCGKRHFFLFFNRDKVLCQCRRWGDV